MLAAVPRHAAADDCVPGAWRAAVAELAHAAETDDVERCGWIDAAGELHWAQNVSRDPGQAFHFSLEEWLEVRGEAAAVAHTHPGGEAWPSIGDQIAQRATGLAQLVAPRGGAAFAYGGDLPRPSLTERPYRWGVTDCWAFVRDVVHAHHGHDLPDPPRPWRCWTQPLFEPAVGGTGWVLLDPWTPTVPGDVWLISVGREAHATHVGIYLGGDVLCHHATGFRAYEPTRRPDLRASAARYEPYRVAIGRPA